MLYLFYFLFGEKPVFLAKKVLVPSFVNGWDFYIAKSSGLRPWAHAHPMTVTLPGIGLNPPLVIRRKNISLARHFISQCCANYTLFVFQHKLSGPARHSPRDVFHFRSHVIEVIQCFWPKTGLEAKWGAKPCHSDVIPRSSSRREVIQPPRGHPAAI